MANSFELQLKYAKYTRLDAENDKTDHSNPAEILSRVARVDRNILNGGAHQSGGRVEVAL
ncbi:MAG TPA: hypothetical protein VMJ93_11455 [Verrucomicrobiae bacterium]|nr:hypothetical protein [Verrucomicrobiae bacterium]